MVFKKVFLVYFKLVIFIFILGWIINVIIVVYIWNIVICVYVMGWKFIICYFWIKIIKCDFLVLDWRKVSYIKYYNYVLVLNLFV